MTKQSKSKQNGVVLISLDGWGHLDRKKGNAIATADTPNIDRLTEQYYSTLINASGTTVGLPDGNAGNSEVGHLTMGSGRSQPQKLVRIEKSIEEGKFESIPALKELFNKAKGHKLHFIGLVSDGGVHSHIKHLFRLIDAAIDAKLDRIYVHAITDGRDTPPNSSPKYIEQLHQYLKQKGVGHLADVIGRHYAMDRDHRWDRVQTAYDLYTKAKGDHIDIDKLAERLKQEGDDQTMPALVVDKDGVIEHGDTIFMFNFRNDRMKELCMCFSPDHRPKSEEIKTDDLKIHVATMTQYDEEFDIPVLFPFQALEQALPEVLACAGLKQFHAAETEKFAHVTFFFNGGREAAVKGETRKLVPSPHVHSYDEKPEMSMKEVADEMKKAIDSEEYQFLLCNLAGADMVAHVGKFEPAVQACSVVDEAVGIICDSALEHNYITIITADHGNAEEMLDDTSPERRTQPILFRSFS